MQFPEDEEFYDQLSAYIKEYRKKAFRVHPDTSGYESTADFQALSNAY